MAQYNADIRIGVTGKTQLNQLEAQLKRTQTQLNKLNKSLKLRARVQAIKLDTRAANTQIKQLEQRINKLGRTITLNVRTNQKEGSKSSKGGGTALAVVNPQAATALAAAYGVASKNAAALNQNAAGITAQVERTNAAQEKVNLKATELEGIYRRQKQALNGFAEKGKSLAQSQNNLNNSVKLREAAQKRNVASLEKELQTLNKLDAAERKRLNTATDLERARTKGLAFEQRLDRRRKANAQKASLRNAGGAAALAGASSIPGLGGAANGALTGAFIGGPKGALIGAAVGGLVDLTKATTAYGNAAAKAAAEQSKFETALRGITSGSDYGQALESISQLSDKFVEDIGTTTKQFTKLTAATTANGLSIKDTEVVYKGLAAANLALGGDAERLQGILLATSQVFSKGKVQAEELRGQIGERLPGAFAMFAKSVGKTPAQLDKALEKGEVTVEDFVTFTKALFKRFEADAQIIADGPDLAGQRLTKNLKALQLALGPLLKGIGSAFQDTFSAIAIAIEKAAIALNSFLGIGLQGAVDRTQTELNRAVERQRIGPGAMSGTTQKQLDADVLKLRDALNIAVEELSTGTAPPITKPKGVEETEDPKTKGSKSGPTDNSANLRIELDLQTKLNALQLETVIGNERAVEKNQRELEVKRLLLESEAERQRIALENTTAESKELANLVRKADLTGELNELAAEQAQTEFDRDEALQDTLRGLQEQMDVESALTDEAKLRVEWAARIAELEQQYPDPERRLQAETQLNKLYAQRITLLDPIVQYQRQLELSLGDTKAMFVSLAQTVETELAGAMSDALTGLVDGTKTVEEAFADMFANIGKAFIDMATQMIAKALILKALGVLFPGSSGSGLSSGMGGMFDLSGGQFGAFADGGFVDSPTQATVGEGGNSEYVIPQNKMASSMDRWNSGMRGDGVVNGAEPTENGYGGVGADVPSAINIEGGVLQFNDSNYIKQDQVPAIIKQASKAGEAKALRKLQMSSATRKQLGM